MCAVYSTHLAKETYCAPPAASFPACGTHIPAPKTSDGRVYRYSPNVDAHPRHFVLDDRVAGFVAEAKAQA